MLSLASQLKRGVALHGHLVFHHHPNNFGQARSASRLPLLWAHLIESDIEARRFRFSSNPSTGGGAHGLNYPPNPEHWVPSLSSFSLHLTGQVFCQCRTPPPFFQEFMLLSAHCRVPVLHRGLEMLSLLQPYIVTSKIFHELELDWQFGIQRWRLRWLWIGWGWAGVGMGISMVWCK